MDWEDFLFSNEDFVWDNSSEEEYQQEEYCTRRNRMPQTPYKPPPKRKCFCAEFNHKRKEEHKKYEEEYQNWLGTLPTNQERYDAFKAKKTFYYKKCDACNPAAAPACPCA